MRFLVIGLAAGLLALPLAAPAHAENLRAACADVTAANLTPP